jgi:hypothetical protein
MYGGHGKYIRNLVRKPEGVSLGRHKCRWKDNVDVYLRESLSEYYLIHSGQPTA